LSRMASVQLDRDMHFITPSIPYSIPALLLYFYGAMCIIHMYNYWRFARLDSTYSATLVDTLNDFKAMQRVKRGPASDFRSGLAMALLGVMLMTIGHGHSGICLQLLQVSCLRNIN